MQKTKLKNFSFSRIGPFCLLFSLAFNLCLFSSTFSQNLHQWGNIGLFHGLPSDKINAVSQTEDGILWFGTDNGLARFDGRRVQTISLEGASQVLAVAARGRELFLGTNNGAFHFIGGKFVTLEGTRETQINTIFVGERVLFGAQNGQIFEFENDKTIKLANLDVPVRALEIEGSAILIGTHGRGLMRFEAGEATGSGLRDQPFFINDVGFDEQRRVWLASRAKPAENGLSGPGFDSSSNTTGIVNSIAFDARGDLWAATAANGVFRVRGGKVIAHYTFESTSGGLRSNQVLDVFVDREGVVWFGTDKGVCRFDDAGPFNILFRDEANANFVRSILKSSDGTILAGTNRGVYRLQDQNWTEVTTGPEKSTLALGEDSRKRLVVGTTANNIRAVGVVNDKTYSIIFGKGLFEDEKLVQTHNEMISLYANGDSLLIGTVADGILEYSGGNLKRLGVLEGNAVRQIAGNSVDGFWAATEKGLFSWRDKQMVEVIPNTEFRSVFANADGIFAGTIGRGLFHVKRHPEFGWLFSNLDVENGLLSSGIFAITGVGESIVIGTGKGVSRFFPNRVVPQILVNRIISERLHSEQEMNSGIALDFPQNTLSIEVTGVSSRTFPEDFQYAFLLKNEKGEIILKRLSNESQISFESLAPGNYSVEIRAFNQHLVESAPVTFRFSVAKAPFPWTSTALAILLAIAIFALIWAIIERRQIVKKNKELAAARFDLANEAERERRRIARDLHDQTLADLRKLMLKSDESGAETAVFRQEIESVSDEIRRICEDLSPSVLENVGLTAALEFLLSNTVAKYEFDCPDNLEERINLPANVQMQIYRIAQEILNNIKRHANADFVGMTISAPDSFELRITNDGIPFTPDFTALPKGRGLSNIRSRAELINARFDWSLTDDGKTVFKLTR